MERLKNPKLLGALAVVVLAVIVFYQNSQDTDIKVLFLGTLKTRLATALALAFLAGLVTGFLAFSRWHSLRKKAQQNSSPSS